MSNSYGFTMKGAFLLEKVNTLPAWSAADEGRLLYNLEDKVLYIGTNAAWTKKETESYLTTFTDNDPLNAGTVYMVDTTSSSLTGVLPLTPSVGQVVTIADRKSTFDTNPFYVNGNGKNIMGLPTLTLSKENSISKLIYDGTQWMVDSGGVSSAAGDVYWNDILSKPATFTPAAHDQTVSTITDFDTEVSNNASVVANTAKVTNANHTGEVIGDAALTIVNKQTLTASNGINVSNTPTVIGTAAPALSLTYGSTVNTVCQGNDARLSDSRVASDVYAWAKDVTLSASSVPNLDAAKITTGTIDISRLPAGALERLFVVTDQTARYALLPANVQNGDTVQQVDTGVMYRVVDDTKLTQAGGYTTYTASRATAVDWSGVENKPATFTPAAHVLNGASHTVSGLTPGYILQALTATTFGFADSSIFARSGANADITSMTALTQITRATGGVFDIALGSAAGDDFTIGTNKLVVEGDTGYVGIGTTDPVSALSVSGSSYINSAISQIRTSGPFQWNHVVNATGAYTLRYGDITVANDLFNVLANGNVGIGIVAPSKRLTVVESIADTDVALMIINSDKTIDGFIYGLQLQNTNATIGNFTALSNLNSSSYQTSWIDFINVDHTYKGAISFSTRDSVTGYGRRMIINESGNVGIGNTAPISLLTVGSGTSVYPTTPAGTAAVSISGTQVLRMVMNDGFGNYNQYLNSYYDSAAVSHKYITAGAASRITMTGNIVIISTAPVGVAGANATFANALYAVDGKVGIGTSVPLGVLCVNGGATIGSDVDAGDNNLRVEGSVTIASLTASLPVITGTGGILQTSSFGTTSGTFCQGNDSRLSDARTPTAHVLNSASHTVSGLTAGQYLRATGATTFGFSAIQAADVPTLNQNTTGSSGSCTGNAATASLLPATATMSSTSAQAISYGFNGGVQVTNAGAGASAITFIRVGVYAVNFGLDTDNVLKVGGFSMGAVSYKIYHEGTLSTDRIRPTTISTAAPSGGASGDVWMKYV